MTKYDINNLHAYNMATNKIEGKVGIDIKDTSNTRAYVLREAERCVCGHREQDYGSPEDNFKIIALLWSAYLDYPVNSLDVAMMMSLLKVARIRTGNGTMDSFIDLAGYAACGGEIQDVMNKDVMNKDVDVMNKTNKEKETE